MISYREYKKNSNNRWKITSGERAQGFQKSTYFWKAARSTNRLKMHLTRKSAKRAKTWKYVFSIRFYNRICYAPCLKNSKNRGNVVRGAPAKTHQKRSAKKCKNLQKSCRKMQKDCRKAPRLRKKAVGHRFPGILLDVGASAPGSPNELKSKENACQNSGA